MSEESTRDQVRTIAISQTAKLPGASDPFYKTLDFPENAEIKQNYEYQLFEKAFVNEDQTAGTKQILDYTTDMSLYSALEVAEPVYNLENLSKLYDSNPFHASAIDAKTDSVVGLGYNFNYSSKVIKQLEKVEKRDETGEKKRVLELKLDDERDKFIEFVSSLNSQDEFQEILQKVYLDRCIMGNAYIEVGRSRDGKISYLGHVSPIHLRVRKKRDGFVQMVKGKTVFFRNFGDQKTRDPINGDPRPNELIHIKRYSPIDEYYGVPEITSSIKAIAGMAFAEQYNIDFFENKAVPRYIIKSKGLMLGENEQMELLKFFETSLKGNPHRTIYVPVPAGNDKDIEFVPVETGKQDGHFLEYIKESTQFILSRHRVPQARIGLSSAATSQAESRESEKTFKETVCQPEQRFLERKLNRVFKELTDLFMFELKEYALTDEDVRSQIHERYLRWGVLVSDEIRTEMGLGPRPDGNGSASQDQLTVALETTEMANEAAKEQLEMQLEAAKEQAKITAAAKPAAAKPSAAKPAQAKAEAKSQAYQNRTRDQQRNSDNPDKNPLNRNGRQPKGAGKPANKR